MHKITEGKVKDVAIKVIDVQQSINAINDEIADYIRKKLKKDKTFMINLMASPGAGKTTTLLKTIELLKNKYKIGVMEADIEATVDAEKMAAAGVKSIQVHTGGQCAMDAEMTLQAIQEFNTDDLDLLVMENVGNLVCPAEFDTGAVKNMTILSVPEGHDKPLKYPLMYETCDLLVVNKIDTIPYFDFDKEKVVEYAKMRNPDIDIIFISAKTGEGVKELVDWIIRNVKEWTEE